LKVSAEIAAVVETVEPEISLEPVKIELALEPQVAPEPPKVVVKKKATRKKAAKKVVKIEEVTPVETPVTKKPRRSTR
jgi:hypothetical protein